MNRHLVVAGFHRSGTSMTAQVLHRAGLNMGEALLLPHPSNRDGHFEDADIVEAHDDLLADAGQSWIFEADGLPAVSAARRDNLVRLADERDRRHAAWGFKDPRVCLFLDAWWSVLPEPVVLIVFRHFRPSIASLMSRSAWSIAMHPPARGDVRFWTEPDLGPRMWLQHNRALIDHARAHPEHTMVVSQDALLGGLPLVAELNARYGFDLDDSAATGIRPEAQSKGDFPMAGVDPGLLEDLERTLDELNELATTGPPESSRSVAAPRETTEVRSLLHDLGLDGDAATGAEAGSPLPGPLPDVSPAPAVAGRAQEVLRSGDARAALALLHAVVGDDEPDALAWHVAGRAHLSMKELMAADRALRRALELEPDRIPFQIELARCLVAQGRQEEAQDLLKPVLQERPRVASAPILLTGSYLRQGRREEAKQLIVDVAAQFPENFPLQANLSRVLHRVGDPDAAREAAEAARRRFPEQLATHELAASLCHQVGRHEEGDRAARQAAATVLRTPGYGRRLLEVVQSVTSEPRRADLESRVARHLQAMAADAGAHDSATNGHPGEAP